MSVIKMTSLKIGKPVKSPSMKKPSAVKPLKAGSYKAVISALKVPKSAKKSAILKATIKSSFK